MSSTEKRDALARDLANGVIAYGAGNADEYRADAERQVDGAIAEALRNAAERLRYLVPHTAPQDRAGLKLGAGQIMQDADALERGAFEQLSEPRLYQDHVFQAPAPEPVADEFRRRRDYIVNAMDAAQLPWGAGADEIRDALLGFGVEVNATDAELESFQALRRQIRDGAP